MAAIELNREGSQNLVLATENDEFLDSCYEWPRGQSTLIPAHEAHRPRYQRQWCRSKCCHRKPRANALRPGKVPDKGDRKYQDLWDVEYPDKLDCVACECLIKTTTVDPKSSSFELRIKCKWAFRTLDTHDRMETKQRVPGIRLPGLIVTVNESRVWKDLEKTKDSSKTVFWRGVSLFTVVGFERFEMHDFPFDRQLMMLELFEFVWRPEKDSKEFVFSMKICSLRIHCISMLPEWDMFPAIIQAQNATKGVNFSAEDKEESPSTASRFTVTLRLQRANWFYIVQVFGLTVLITMASLTPMMLPANVNYIGNRLGLYSGGILTLTATKYSISDQLPSVPYSTMFDRVMFKQFACVFACACEAVVVYRYVPAGSESQLTDDKSLLIKGLKVSNFELVTVFLLMLYWVYQMFYLSAEQYGFRCGFNFKSWQFILEHQEEQAGNDETEQFDVVNVKKKTDDDTDDLRKVNEEIETRLAGEGTNLETLFKRRKNLEESIKKSADRRNQDNAMGPTGSIEAMD